MWHICDDIITVTSYSLSNHRPLTCLLQQLVMVDNAENTKGPYYWHFVRRIHGGFPWQRTSNKEKRFHVITSIFSGIWILYGLPCHRYNDRCHWYCNLQQASTGPDRQLTSKPEQNCRRVADDNFNYIWLHRCSTTRLFLNWWYYWHVRQDGLADNQRDVTISPWTSSGYFEKRDNGNFIWSYEFHWRLKTISSQDPVRAASPAVPPDLPAIIGHGSLPHFLPAPPDPSGRAVPDPDPPHADPTESDPSDPDHPDPGPPGLNSPSDVPDIPASLRWNLVHNHHAPRHLDDYQH